MIFDIKDSDRNFPLAAPLPITPYFAEHADDASGVPPTHRNVELCIFTFALPLPAYDKEKEKGSYSVSSDVLPFSSTM